MYLRNLYIKTIADKMSISVEDLLQSELDIINASFDIFNERLDDIIVKDKEIYRLNIELANLKSSLDDKDYNY